jgi:hypothetical protein
MRIILGAVLSRHPFVPGSVWHRLNYILGLRKLGHEVYWVEDVHPSWCVDVDGRKCPFDRSVNRELFRQTLDRFDLTDRACQIYNQGEATFGMSMSALVEIARGADLLLNMSGHVKARPVLESVARRAYEDHDPVYTQLWCAEYGKDLGFAAHEVFFTRGLNIGTPYSHIPDCGVQWNPILPPVVPEYWPAARDDRGGRRFTTVASWGGYSDLCYRGEWYRSKYAEFRRFADLPRRVGRELEVVLKGYRPEDEGVGLLRDNGWHLVDPDGIADLCAYQEYIARSRAEIGIAKNAYVKGRSGWFSDRAAHYLASGRPVLHQSTGFERHIPTSRGLLSFATVEEAAAGIEAIDRDYDRHCEAAREIAAEYLDYRKVLPALLEACMAPAARRAPVVQEV